MSSKSDPTGTCGLLADYLHANKDELLKKWLAEARKDAVVLSDNLTQFELTDHIPKIFDAVVEALRSRCGQTKADVQNLTARHTVIRWVQQYDLQSVLREVSLLRTQFVNLLLTFDAQNTDNVTTRLLHGTAVHQILDDIVLDATETYIMLKNRALEDR